jgi:hypothetical protein
VKIKELPWSLVHHFLVKKPDWTEPSNTTIAHLKHLHKHCAGIAKVLYLKIVYSFAAFLFSSFIHLPDGRNLPLMHVPMIYIFQQENIILLMLAVPKCPELLVPY